MRKFAVVACLLVVAAPAQAQCGKTMLEITQFLLPYASTNFAAIKGSVSAPGDASIGMGGQYNFSEAAAQYCPNSLILEDTPAHDKYPEFWEVKFDSHEAGNGDDVAVALIKRFSPVLKAAGYQDKPYIDNGDDPNTYNMEWDGPSDTWVTIDTFLESGKPGMIDYEIKVAHDVK
ncbi:MAG: hypothetical protein KGJ79_17535 [Alphaproteobacteria bacterium]|nr:hypothetical protein [Alphaproteobacteria bacterium]MDE2112942.1 hypothetical protein [Alphaproteobacteria bacterium]MDE2495916.1 hypothetical protein [Alphaproteobacteria bacterium]